MPAADHLSAFSEASDASRASAASYALPAVCVDDRTVRWQHGTGAASYQATLRRAVALAGYRMESLTDAAQSAKPPPGRAWRWAAAAWPGAVPAPVEEGSAQGPAQNGRRVATDVFRRAQVHFDIHGRYLRLRSASPPALMHWSYPLPLRFAGVPNLYSVLDLIPLLRPDLTPIHQARARRMLARLRREATHLTTISEASRRDIIATLGWPPERVTNTSLALDLPPWSDADADAAARRAMDAAGLARGGYFLHAGTVEPRKNIARLIAAYRASRSCRALVLAGPDGAGAAAAELAGTAGLLVQPGDAARAASGRPRILRLPWLAREDLLGLVHGAAAVLAPSLAEGFGLPAVEAMALGTPALTSRGGATEEAAGGAALLADPLDVRALAAAISALDTDPALRGCLAAAGRRRAGAFGLAAYADRLAALYGAILDAGATRVA